ncbi:MAG: ABC transporter ATP-binding protein [Anaeroplasmataceae bacterium]
MNEILKVSNISKTFKLSSKQQKLEKDKIKYRKAVDDLSFSVCEGEIYGLLGPNGAGKTTTLRMISTLIKQDSGSIYIDGFDTLQDSEKVRTKIGFLTSELKLEEFFTPNYLFDFFSSLHNISKEDSDVRKEYLFSKFGIDKFREVRISDLSTGMKQKISLVISICHDPKFIIFDEPTNGLDVLTAKVVIDFLNILKEEGKTIILSTHIFDLVEKLCDRVGIIIDGKMIIDDKLVNVCKEKSLEDTFFDIYNSVKVDDL